MHPIAVAAVCLMSVVSPIIAAGQGHAGHAAAEAPAPSTNGGHADETLGTVRFRTSCAPAIQPAFDRAVALMHSFQFGLAIDGFRGVLAQGPGCTIADWGIALSHWSNPFAGYKSPVQLAQGLAAVNAARLRAPGTAREQAYVDAVAHLYVDSAAIEQQVRVDAYEQAMARLVAAYPDDVEAKIFHALALAAAADPADKTYAKQLQAGAMLESLFARYPDHPGLAHYIIHAYDEPDLAERAAEAARRYSAIAPSTPHALHMPSHTFTRIGDWQASIATNRASAAAAKQAGQPADEMHASDYMVYAYLQTAQDEAARTLVLDSAEAFERFDPANATGAAPASAGFFAAAAIPARYCLERRDWKATQTLTLHPSRFPHADAITIFARGLGAAHLGDVQTAERSIADLSALRERLVAADDGYWADQVEIQRLQVAAQMAVAQGDALLARALLTRAAAMEDVTELASITPGPFIPAREMLGERLLEDSQPALALVQFRRTLARQPNRFWSVYGAARAASASNHGTAARGYFRRLLDIAQPADKPPRAALVAARFAVRKNVAAPHAGG